MDHATITKSKIIKEQKVMNQDKQQSAGKNSVEMLEMNYEHGDIIRAQ